MVSCFGAIHHIAAERGDGLRPELLDLFKRSRVIAEIAAMTSYPLPRYEMADIGAQVNDHCQENTFRHTEPGLTAHPSSNSAG